MYVPVDALQSVGLDVLGHLCLVQGGGGVGPRAALAQSITQNRVNQIAHCTQHIYTYIYMMCTNII